MQNNRWLQTLIVLLVIIAAAWLAGQVWTFLLQFSNIILLFFLAWLLAFILSPIARAMQRRGVPKTLSVLIVYLGLAIIAFVGGWFLVPAVTFQVNGLILNFGSYQDKITNLLQQGIDTLKGWGVDPSSLNNITNQLTAQAYSVGQTALSNTFSFLQSIATFALQLILILLLSFYFMNDSDRIFGGVLSLLPPRWQDEARLVALSVEKSFGGFIRGQLLFAFIYAIFTAGIMLAPPFHLEYVIVASIIAGMCMIIPIVGNFLAYMPPIMVALVTGRTDIWVLLLVVELVMQSLMMNLVGPRVMSSAIGIHPLYVMAAMLAGGQVMGIWGALFGIPIAGSINLIGRPVMRRLRYQTTLYKEPAESMLSTSAFLTGPLAVSMSRAGPGTGTAVHLPEPEVLTGAAQALKQPTGGLVTGVGTAASIPVANRPTAPVLSAPQAVASTVPGAPAAYATQPHAPLDLDDDLIIRPGPTLTMRLWRFAFAMLGRGYHWVGRRANIRSQARR